MIHALSKIVDRLSNFFANRKGLLPLVAILLAIINFILRISGSGWLADSDLLLHLAFILAVFGFLLDRAL
jgi:TRAP-type mannitol/chloroaromatic compound transport system permease small subunit